jgi:RNA polymerase sigma factor (sigma-70 family)
MSGSQDDLYQGSQESIEILVRLTLRGHPRRLTEIVTRINAGDLEAVDELAQAAKTASGRPLTDLVERAKSLDPFAIAELVESAQRNAHFAFKLLQEQCQRDIRGHIRNTWYDENCFEEIVQETLMRIWLYLPNLRDLLSFKRWSRRIATNVVNDFGRVKQKTLPTIELERVDVANEFADPDRIVPEREEIKEIIKRVADKYPHKEWLCFWYSAKSNMSDNEIAKLLGINENVVPVYRSKVNIGLEKALFEDVSCGDCQEELAASRLKDLSKSMRKAFEKHIDSCKCCRIVQGEYHTIDELVSAILSNGQVLESRHEIARFIWENLPDLHQHCFWQRVSTNRTIYVIARDNGTTTKKVREYCAQVTKSLSEAVKQNLHNNGKGDESNE